MTAYIVSISMLIIFLLAVGAFFSMTETAFTSLSRIKVRQLQKEKARHADLIAKLRSNLDELIATVLIGTNFVNTFNSAVTTAFAVKVFGAEYVSAATAVILFLVIIFVEIVPKTFAAINTDTAVKNTAIPVYLIKAILYPVVKTFCLFTRFIDFAEKKIFKSKRVLVTEDELKTLIEVGQSERKMLERLFEFSDLSVHSIMRHRSLVKYISTETSLDEVIAIFQTTGYSRIPVYENDVENIVGVLHFKSVLFASPLITASKDFIKICMAEPAFVPETMSAIENAKRYFAKYGKLKRTYEALITLTEETKASLEYLESIAMELNIAVEEEDLIQIKEEMMDAGFLKRKGNIKKARTKSKPFHYISSDGFDIYVGKNNYQNEELTFKFAGNKDWWFHAKNAPGSHVIVKTEGKELPDRTFEEAAALAAYYSKGRDNDKVEVDYVEKKQVKKPAGAKPGFVVYYTNYSMVAVPDISSLTLSES